MLFLNGGIWLEERGELAGGGPVALFFLTNTLFLDYPKKFCGVSSGVSFVSALCGAIVERIQYRESVCA
jgi:hypothetical protein